MQVLKGGILGICVTVFFCWADLRTFFRFMSME